jgi:membrane protein
MKIRNAFTITGKALVDCFNNNVFKLAASLAYFTVFSLPGLLIITIWIGKFIYGKEVVENSLYDHLANLIGSSAAESIHQTVRAATTQSSSTIATIVGITSLVIGATSVFSEIQDSINYIWKLKVKPRKGRGFVKMLFNRLLSFSMIISLGFILLVSLFINGAMDILMNHLMARYPALTVVLIYMVNLLSTYLIAAIIFAAIFKVLPDARVEWRHVWRGAFVTALLFLIGKFLLSYYFSHTSVGSAYGTAGSIIAVLLWVYYSAIILYFGAAFTHAYVVHKGSRIYPNSYAVWVQQIEVESDKAITQQPVEKTVVETGK